MNKEVCVFGNGRSLQGFEFNKINRDKYDIVGTGMAFRYWDTIDWYPDIYVNVDKVVCQNEEVINFVKQDKCKYYIVSSSMLEKEKDLNPEKVFLFESLLQFPSSTLRFVRNWCSGTSAVVASLDRYQTIHMFGFDVDYVEFIPECVEEEDGTLTIEKTPETNPNYFFDSYQREGDKYNKPNGERVHMKSWEELSYIIEFINKMYPEHKVSMTNYNSKKSISEYFTTKALEDFPMI